MKKLCATAVASVCLLLALLPVRAEAQASPNCPALVDQTLNLIGLTERLQFSVDDLSGMKIDGISDEMNREVRELTFKELGPKPMLSSVRAQFLQQCDAEFLRSVIEQLQSPALQPVLQSERRFAFQQFRSGEGKAAQKLDVEKELTAAPASDERIALMADLDRALKMTENAVDFEMIGLLSTFEGARINSGIQENDVELSKAALRSKNRKTILKLNLLAYRNLTDDQLRAYVDASSRTPLRDFNAQLNRYLKEAFQQGAVRFGEQLRPLLQRARAQHQQ